MLTRFWTLAREWAAEARSQQGSMRWQARLMFGLSALAAVLAAVVAGAGADPSKVPAAGALPWHWTSVVSVLAGIVAAAAAGFGRFVQQGAAKKKWVAARTAAEMCQSECYRFAAQVSPYTGSTAAQRFDQRITAIDTSARQSGAMPRPLPGDAPASGRAAPNQGMDAAWYRKKTGWKINGPGTGNGPWSTISERRACVQSPSLSASWRRFSACSGHWTAFRH